MTISEYCWFNYNVNPAGLSLFEHWQQPAAGHFNHSTSDAVAQFNLLFDKLCSSRVQRKHLVPISGGFDSRAILAALLARVPAENIETISFGFPGQLDYDVGALVSNALGVKHHQLNLVNIKLTWPMLVETAKRSPATFHFDALFNHLSRTRFTNEDYTIWSGFMGDPLAGSHLSRADMPTLMQTLQSFVVKQRKVKTLSGQTPELSACQTLMQPLLSQYQLRPEDVVNFCLRQANCIAPIVLPVKCWQHWQAEVGSETTGAEVLAPFIDKDWAQYWLYAPAEQRLGQQLYMDMLQQLFSVAMALPSKNSFGLPPHASARIYIKSRLVAIKAKLNQRFTRLRLTRDIRTNYLDYAAMFRQREDYQAILQQAFTVLANADIFPAAQLHNLQHQHMTAQANHAERFCLFIGLAANVDAGIL
ncbi:asparagine synthase-related protein [Bermanella sp. R86510]|uniref:asparagine synthase-related protein n=1 Tax=unclassified Bermanella TaxID=2627862 RepID=UPI0037CB609B